MEGRQGNHIPLWLPRGSCSTSGEECDSASSASAGKAGDAVAAAPGVPSSHGRLSFLCYLLQALPLSLPLLALGSLLGLRQLCHC